MCSYPKPTPNPITNSTRKFSRKGTFKENSKLFLAFTATPSPQCQPTSTVTAPPKVSRRKKRLKNLTNHARKQNLHVNNKNLIPTLLRTLTPTPTPNRNGNRKLNHRVMSTNHVILFLP